VENDRPTSKLNKKGARKKVMEELGGISRDHSISSRTTLSGEEPNKQPIQKKERDLLTEIREENKMKRSIRLEPAKGYLGHKTSRN